MHTITDNFLPQEQFIELRDTIVTQTFPWYFNPTVVYSGENETEENSPGYFTHSIYDSCIPLSNFYNSHFQPLFNNVLDVAVILRIQLNLQPRLPEPFYSEFHIDLTHVAPDIIVQAMTSIFYINTNNGYTELEDGTRIESVANRLVTFPLITKHRSVSQTDEKRRIVVNFCYLKQFRVQNVTPI